MINRWTGALTLLAPQLPPTALRVRSHPHTMHPRNAFAVPPDLRDLAARHPSLRPFTHQNGGYSWGDPSAVRAMTSCLLHSRYGLAVDPPPDRLTPPVPNRLNYILVVEDLLASSCARIAAAVSPPSTTGSGGAGVPPGNPDVVGLDVGTGAIAIYALLAHAVGGWRMVATELDERSAACAAATVAANHLTDRIRVCRSSSAAASGTGGLDIVHSDSLLSGALSTYAAWAAEGVVTTSEPLRPCSDVTLGTEQSSLVAVGRASSGGAGLAASTAAAGAPKFAAKSKAAAVAAPPFTASPFSFTMCNPPFFGSWEEATASMAARADSACTGTPIEMVGASSSRVIFRIAIACFIVQHSQQRSGLTE